MSAPVVQSPQTFRSKYVPLADFSLDELKRLPIDPEGWCHVGRDHSWVHTSKCREFTGYGHPALCDLFGELDRRERKQESARTQRQIADAEMRRDGHFDPPTGGYDGELARRQANTERGAW